ncbi:MAG: SusC/RagA family TonB-linked outer membrane protein [Tannerella sp.]|jgi:TonB-linked SusC/RagA family outer membrane protein|nr:SusC/RagA family TonB-linked outer membrane protein [Tannerella sp.]
MKVKVLFQSKPTMKRFLCLLLVSFCATFGYAQNGNNLSGMVTDEDGNPLIGVNISVKGTSLGTMTDMDGKFSLTVASGTTLQISYIGYIMQEIIVGNQTNINIALKEGSLILDEVVVMAYGSTIKRKVIASVANVDVKQIETLAGYKDLGTALQGRISGVFISNNSGGPDASPSISIRGGGDPMYVIDGVVQDKSFFMRLTPQDIESMSVMKDAASSAVYGATAANGIIVVQTKAGRKGKTKISYILEQQFNTPTVVRDKLTALQEAELKNAISDYMGSAKPYSDDVLTRIRNGTDNDYPDNDWWNILVKKVALSQRHTLTLDGGSDNTQYRTSFMVYDQGTLQKKVAGDIDPIDYKTYSLDMNLVHYFKNTGVKLSLDMKPYIVDNKKFGGDPWLAIKNLSAMTKTYNKNGAYAPNSPIASYADTRGGYVKNFNFGNDMRANLDWDVLWIKGLKAVLMGSYALANTNSKNWNASVPTYNEDGSIVTVTDPQLQMDKRYSWRYEINAGLKYDAVFSNKHNLSVSLFYNQRESYSESIYAKRINYYDYVDQIFAGPANDQTTGGSASESGRLGYVGVLNYDYMSKYLLTVNFRYDGSDAYRKGARWGFFPSAAIGYVVSEERFMDGIKDKTTLSLMKLRASIGQIGETSGRFDYLSNWELNPTGAYIGGITSPTVRPGALASEDLTWYTTNTWNAGIDFGFLKDRLTGSADYFFRRTTGYLINPLDRYNAPLGNTTGQIVSNSYVFGLPKTMSDDAFRRAGAEFQLFWKDVINDFSYGIGVNFSFYDQLWEKYAAQDTEMDLANPNIRQTHKTLGQGARVYDYIGLFRTSDQLLNTVIQNTGNAMMAGDVIMMDINGDGQINTEDMIYDNNPRNSIMQWGIPFNAGYKGWFMEGLIQGSGPQYGMVHGIYRGTGWLNISYQDQLDFYHPGNTNAVYPRADNDYGAWNGELNRQDSKLWIVNKTYARLKNLSIGYDLKHKFLKEFKYISFAKLSFVASNILTISPAMKYFDPETGPLTETLVGGTQANSYPVTSTYSIMLNMGF